MRLHATFFIALALLAAAPAAAATPPTNLQRFQTFLRSDAYRDALDEALSRLSPDVFRRCNGLLTTGARVTVTVPAVFDAAGAPTRGAWRQEIPISGCGNRTVLNLYFFVAQDGKLATINSAPGTTRADYNQQADALFQARTGAATIVKECETFAVRTTRFVAYQEATGTARVRPWREIWTMIGCGASVDVPLDFTPNASGVEVSAPFGAIDATPRRTAPQAE
jgi:hypothetical protein